MKKLISFFRDGGVEEVLGCLMILTVIVPVIVNIVNRSVFGFYSINLEAVALLAYVWIGYAFFGYLYKKDAHVDMKFLVNMMSPSARAVFDLLRDLLILVFSVYMVYWGVKLCGSNLTRYATGTKIPLAFGYASIAFGFFTGAVRSFYAIITRLFKKKKEVPEQ